MTAFLSIIIPTLNEAQVIGRTLAPLRRCPDCEVLVVDGGSSDATLAVARAAGCITVAGPRARSRQMNAGAAAATGRVLLFLHADTLLPADFCRLIAEAVSRPDFAAGAFSLAIDSPDKGLAAIAWFANLRSRWLHLPYGDQALFVTQSLFTALGGFPELAIMEDFVFIRQVRKEGEIVILPECATTSARRWRNMGIVRTTLVNQLIVCGYGLGVPPATLARWYRRLRGVDKHHA